MGPREVPTDLGWLFLSFQKQYFLATFLYKIINNHYPSYAPTTFSNSCPLFILPLLDLDPQTSAPLFRDLPHPKTPLPLLPLELPI